MQDARTARCSSASGKFIISKKFNMVVVTAAVYYFALRITEEIVIAGYERNGRIHKYVCGELQEMHRVHQII